MRCRELLAEFNRLDSQRGKEVGKKEKKAAKNIRKQKINAVLIEARDKMFKLCQEFAATGDFQSVDETVRLIRVLNSSMY